jgi:hypothetical protein
MIEGGKRQGLGVNIEPIIVPAFFKVIRGELSVADVFPVEILGTLF